MSGRVRIVIAAALCCLALQTVGCATGYGTDAISVRRVAMTVAARPVAHPTPSPTARACGGLPKFDIVPAAPGTRVTTALSGPAGGPHRLSVWIGLSVSVFTVTADGSITG